MHDIRLIRETPDAFDSGLVRRGLAPAAAFLRGDDRGERLLPS